MKLFALLTCDEVLIDSGSGKHSILGHFSSIKVKTFPAVHPSLNLFVGITDIPAGEHTLEIKFGNPNEVPPTPTLVKKSFFGPTETTPPPDPLKTLLEQKLISKGPDERIYLISELKDLPFDKEAAYQIGLLLDRVPLGTTSLGVSKA